MQRKHLKTFSLALMIVAAVMSLRGLPMIAREGLSMVFYLIFAAIFFLLPTSFISAELAASFPVNGGIYRWVKEAFGPRWGFLAIWLQWVQNIVWYPTVLAFSAGALSYLFLSPELAANKLFTFAVILIVYWLATFIAFRGIHIAGFMTSIGVVIGTIIPALIIIALAFYWWGSGHPILFLDKSKIHFFPNLSHVTNIAFLAGIVLLFAGMEVNAVHINEMQFPSKQFPKSVLTAMLIIIIVFTLGSLALAAVLPASNISLTAGVMQAFDKIFTTLHITWLTPLLGFLVTVGVLAAVIAWVGGPSRGLLTTAKDGDLPPFLKHTNACGVQTHILWIQGIIVTLIALIYVVTPNVNVAFSILTALTAILYLIMYMLLYLSALILRYKNPKLERPYKVPGGVVGLWVFVVIGLAAVIFAFVVGFFPPSQLRSVNPSFYVSFLIIGTILFVLVPWIIELFRKPSWVADEDSLVHSQADKIAQTKTKHNT